MIRWGNKNTPSVYLNKETYISLYRLFPTCKMKLYINYTFITFLYIHVNVSIVLSNSRCFSLQFVFIKASKPSRKKVFF